MRRRDFIKIGGAAAAVCACGTLGSCSAITGTSSTPTAEAGSYTYEGGKLRLELAKNKPLEKAGGAVKLSFEADGKGHKMIIARDDADSYLAFEDKCTHGGRELEYQHDKNRFECVSFGGSKFSKVGSVLAGPADKPLTKYTVTTEDDYILVSV